LCAGAAPRAERFGDEETTQSGGNVMSMMVRCFWALLAALLVAAPARAQQACTQSDIAGVWELYIGLGDDDDDDDDDDILDDDSDGWSACRITVQPAGGVSGPCVTAGGSSFRIVGGQLNLRDSCLIAGRFVARADDERVTLVVSRAALSRSGDVIAGGTRGRVDDDDDDDDDDFVAALFQMIRR
jgi:hypothetical protein